MFEEGNSYEEIVERSLSSERVSPDVDKREGSVLFNAVAPASDEFAFLYMLLDAVYENGFAGTAEREWLVLRAAEHGIEPYPASYAVVKGAFNMEIPEGCRFNYVISDEEEEGDGLNYTTGEFIESHTDADGNTVYYFQLECETAGTRGNITSGALSAIDYLGTGLSAEIAALLIPGEDEEDTESLRERYFDSFSETPFGGNQADYRLKTKAIPGVGGVKITPVWDGGGTVKLTIIDSNFNPASSILVGVVKEAIDPFDTEGLGVGLAPIGHRVTVVSCASRTVDVLAKVTLESGYVWEDVQEAAEDAVGAYFLELRKAWEDTEKTVVRISQIENRILNLDGVVDVQDTELSGRAENLVLPWDVVPVLGGVWNADG